MKISELIKANNRLTAEIFLLKFSKTENRKNNSSAPILKEEKTCQIFYKIIFLKILCVTHERSQHSFHLIGIIKIKVEYSYSYSKMPAFILPIGSIISIKTPTKHHNCQGIRFLVLSANRKNALKID